MKSKKTMLKNLIKYVCIGLLAISIQSCETEIPPEDATPPAFTFHIYGDTFDHTFNQDTDFENIRLRLKRNTTYNFTYIGSDEGGVNYVIWSVLPARELRINGVNAPWISNSTNGNQYIRWNGDRSNPLTGAAISGSFTAPHNRNDVVFRFRVTDFGGETRRPNSISKELNILTGNVGHIGIQNL